MTGVDLDSKQTSVRVLAIIGLLFIVGIGIPVVLALITAIPDIIKYVQMRRM